MSHGAFFIGDKGQDIGRGARQFAELKHLRQFDFDNASHLEVRDTPGLDSQPYSTAGDIIHEFRCYLGSPVGTYFLHQSAARTWMLGLGLECCSRGFPLAVPQKMKQVCLSRNQISPHLCTPPETAGCQWQCSPSGETICPGDRLDGTTSWRLILLCDARLVIGQAKEIEYNFKL